MNTAETERRNTAERLLQIAHSLMDRAEGDNERAGSVFLVNLARLAGERAETLLRDSGGLPRPIEVE